jgi:hypothetical protein
MKEKMTKEEKDIILNKELGGIKISAMSGMAFKQWALKKLDGVAAFNPGVAPLVQSINLSLGNMSDEDKLELIEKLQKVGIDI